MEEGESSTPFWIQSPTNRRRNRRRLLNSGVLLFTLSITTSLFILFIISPLFSLSPQFSRPINSFKKNWDSFNILIVLLALMFGFFSRIRNNHDSISAVGSLDDGTDDKIGNEVHKSHEYGYSDRTAVVDDQIGTDNRNEVQKSTVSGWHEYSDWTAVDGLRIYPDPRVISPPEDGGDRWHFHNDVSLAREANALATRANEISPPEDSGDRWRFQKDMSLAREADAWATRANEISPQEDSEDRKPYDEMSLAREANALDTRANGASRVREAQSPQLELFNEGVKILSTGTVIGAVDGIASIRGLDEVAEGEIVEFDEGVIGIALHRESKDSVCVVLMDDSLILREGTFVRATGKIAQIPANEACLGHIVNAIATPIDGRGEISTTESRMNEGTEVKQVEENRAPPPVVRRRKHRTIRRIANKGKSSEEGSGWEPPEQSSRRKAKMTLGNTGTVLEVGDGIARIHCLDNVTVGEIIEFGEGTIGIALNSESTDNVGVVLMGDGLHIQEGSSVKATGEIAQIQMDEACLDRVIKALAKPINNKVEISVPVSGLVEETEIKPLEKGKTNEEVSDLEPPGQFWTHESTARDNKQSHLGSDTDESIPSKEAASEKLNYELETNEYESLFLPMLDPPISPPQTSRGERKRGGGNATRDFLASFRKRKKKQRQKSVENLETLLDSQPPSPLPPSAVQSFFSSKKGKSKRVIDISPPPSPPPPYFIAAHEQESVAVEAPAITHRPPLPVKVRNFVEVASNSGGESPLTGAESPLHLVPPPPPPPPFQMPGWKFVVKGDYVKIGSTNSSRSVSPEPDEVDFPASSNSGWTPKAVDSGDMAAGAMFCPSPDVNLKADVFIAKFRAGLKLQKMNSIKQKQGVGLSNLGPASNPNQAQA